MYKFKTVITVQLFFTNHNAPGNLTLGYQKTLDMDVNITPNMDYRLRLFNEYNMLGKVIKVEILDRGYTLIKEVTVDFKNICSTQDLLHCNSEKLKEELESLGFGKMKNL